MSFLCAVCGQSVSPKVGAVEATCPSCLSVYRYGATLGVAEKKFAPKNTEYVIHEYLRLGHCGYGLCPEEQGTCVMSWGRGWVVPAHIIIGFSYPIDLERLRRDYSATRIRLERVKVKANYWQEPIFLGTTFLGLGITADTTVLHEAVDQPIIADSRPSWHDNEFTPGDDVTGYNTLNIELLHNVNAFTGHFEHHTAALEVVLELETPVETHHVTVLVEDDKGFAVEGAEVTVNRIESGRTDRYGFIGFDLVEGRYTARASKTIDGKVWSGETRFSVPKQLDVKVTLSPPREVWETAMWVGAAGIAVVAGVSILSTVAEIAKRE